MKRDPGIYEDMPFDEYKAIDAVNASSLAAVERSTFHWDYMRRNPPPATRALEFGSAFHAMILEPEEFKRNYDRNPYGNWRTKVAREYRDALKEQGKIAIADNPDASSPWEAGDWFALQQMKLNLDDHETAPGLLNGRRELTIVWEDPDFDILCKGRIDCRNDVWNFLVDLKTTQDASKREFMRSVIKWGYDAQAAFYMDGWEDVTGGKAAKSFVIVATEKVPPFETACYAISPEFISRGRGIYKQALSKLRKALQEDDFKSYDQGLVSLEPYFTSGRGEAGHDK